MKVVCFVLVLTGLHLSVTSNSVKVSLYYETLCPDCMNFIKNQLHLNYKLFGRDLVQLELIPYGNAKENGPKNFTCQHGPNECYGNEVEGCVINSESIDTSESFVSCSEDLQNTSLKANLKHCAEKNHIKWEGIEECLSSGKALDIMADNGSKTRKLALKWVPTIVFNDKFSAQESNEAQNDLKGVICKYVDNKKICDEPHRYQPNVVIV
ncbi:GILT-like protein 1 [Euwallacea fornicatus]|uniref:GILT-like protein 1 n=1 Tax=Euwallacea fornicatus TaxID=995702 RepID=UPI00338D947D